MRRLRTAELEALLGFAEAAAAVEGPEPFTTELVDELTTIFRAEFVTFEDLDLVERRVISYVPCSNEVAMSGATAGELTQDDWDGVERSTTLAALRAGHAVRTWSELFSRRDRLGHNACELSREWGVFDQLVVWLDRRRTRNAVVSVHRQRDFGDRERELATRLRPHFVALRRAAAARRQVAAARAALECQSADDTWGVVLLDDAGRIASASSAARRMLAPYADADSLPPTVADWLRVRSVRDRRLVLRRPGCRLVVEAADSALVVLEEPELSVPLTAREWDVMRCVAAGMSNAATARLLWVTPATVRKHLENVYAKLGVHSRTAAVARLRPTLTAPDPRDYGRAGSDGAAEAAG